MHTAISAVPASRHRHHVLAGEYIASVVYARALSASQGRKSVAAYLTHIEASIPLRRLARMTGTNARSLRRTIQRLDDRRDEQSDFDQVLNQLAKEVLS